MPIIQELIPLLPMKSNAYFINYFVGKFCFSNYRRESIKNLIQGKGVAAVC
jgi:hypothetical protein